jgi:chloramphenicol-sensitive protein RarD
LPVYWKWLVHVDALEILSHRILWTAPFVALVLTLAGRWQAVRNTVRDLRQVALLGLTTVLIALNWGIYIWAVNNDQVVPASLGYFLTPLLHVLVGIVLFHERPRLWQWLAVALAASGVLVQFLFSSTALWVSLSVGLTFALYGGLRKLVSADSASGLFLEAAVLAPFALAWMVWVAGTGQAAFLVGQPLTDLLLVLCGVVTGVPLLLFVAGTKRLPMTTVGLLFYLTPSLQFLLGVFVYGERVDTAQALAFALIGCALVLFTLEGRYAAGRRGLESTG